MNVTCHVIIIGDPVPGIWCDDCKKATAIEQVCMYRLLSQGQQQYPPWMPGTIRTCQECGATS